MNFFFVNGCVGRKFMLLHSWPIRGYSIGLLIYQTLPMTFQYLMEVYSVYTRIGYPTSRSKGFLFKKLINHACASNFKQIG